jgi:hypothetical protein
MKELAREGLVHDRYALRLRAVGIGKRASHEERNLQSAEVVGRYVVDHTRHNRLSPSLPSLSIQVVLRDASRLKIMHLGSGLEIDARRLPLETAESNAGRYHAGTPTARRLCGAVHRSNGCQFHGCR